MSTTTGKRDLTPEQLSEALAILNKEKDANVLTTWQKVVFVLLNVSVIGLLVVLLLVSFYPAIEEALIVFLGMLILLLPLLFLSNIPLFVKFARQMSLIRKLGLSEVLTIQWMETRKKTKFSNVVTRVFSWIGWLLIATAVIASFTLFSEFHGDTLLGVVTFIGLGAAFLAIYYVRKNRQKLEIVVRLQKSLQRRISLVEQPVQPGASPAGQPARHRPSTGMIKSDSQIEIPHEDYELIARIERAQISRDRVQSIVESLKSEQNISCAVQKSEAFRESLTRLDESKRLAVENQVDRLATRLQPSGGTPRADRILHVPDTDLQITYAVDEKKQQLQLLSLSEVTHFTGKENNG